MTALLLSGVSIGSTGYIAAFTVSTLAAQRITGSPTWSGATAAAVILGTAAGTTLLAELSRRLGRRRGLLFTYGLGGLGALAAAAAVVLSVFPLLLASMFVIGLGQSANFLTRYYAADLHPVERRGQALGWLIWAGTVGAVAGPNLLAPAGRLAAAAGLPELSGGFLATLVLFFLTVLLYGLLMHPRPETLILKEVSRDDGAGAGPGGLQEVLGLPRIQAALATLVVGHVVMVLIMTMTPLHIEGAGHGLGSVGLVMSAHILGMFALSPLTGRLADRLGSLPVILLGQGLLLVSAVAAALAPTTRTPLLMAALFLLGLGWNCGFVAGSSLLSRGLELESRTRLQGFADSAVWVSAAAASFASSFILGMGGYAALCAVGALLLTVPLASVVRWQRTVVAESV